MLEREYKEVDAWGDDYFEPTPNSRQVRVRGRVFLDAAASPSRGGGTKPPLKGIPVSDEERIAVTDQDGAFAFSVFVDEHRVIRLQLPSGFQPTTPWYQLIRGDDTQTDYFFEFGLRKTPGTAAGKAFNFAVIADSQFSDQKAAERYREDLRQIEALSETPEFILHCGDLVKTGWLREWKLYDWAVRDLAVPIYHVVGGHEENYGQSTWLERPSDGHFKLFCGPTWYAFDVAGVHFIVIDQHKLGSSPAALARQQAWLKADLRRLAKGARVFIAAHYPLDIRPWLRKCEVLGFVYGHWHETTRHAYRDVPFLKVAAIRGGDLGMFSRPMQIARIGNGNGRLTTEVRILGQHRRLEHVATAAVPGQPRQQKISVIGYHTSTDIRAVTCTDSNGKTKKLTRSGDWTWSGTVPKTAGRRQKITLQAVGDNDERWQKRVTMPPTPATVPEIRVDADWTWFGRDFQGGRWTDIELPPPLTLAWCTATGSRLQTANSPILYRRRLYMGTQQCDVNGRAPRLLCISSKNGTVIWRRDLDGDSMFSPAAADGLVFVTTNQGSTYAFDARTGKRRWKRNLFGRHGAWTYHKLSSPVMPYQGTLLVSAESGPFVVYDAGTGKTVHRQEEPPMLHGLIGFSVPFPDHGMLYWNGYNTTLAQNMRNREIAWTRDTRGIGTRGIGMGLLEGNVFYQNNTNSVTAFDGTTGETLWQQPARAGCFAAAVIVGPETLIGGGVERLCLSKRDGSTIWAFEADAAPAPATANRGHKVGGQSTPCVAGQTVYFGGEDGYLYALDRETGECRWRYYLALPIKSSPIVSGNSLFVSDFDGNLFGFVATR